MVIPVPRGPNYIKLVRREGDRVVPSGDTAGETAFLHRRDGVLEHRGSGGIGRHSGLKKGRLSRKG